MLSIPGIDRPLWRSKDINGNLTNWDGEWHYHFRDGGYSKIEWCEIKQNGMLPIRKILEVISPIGLWGFINEDVITVVGWANDTGTLIKLGET